MFRILALTLALATPAFAQEEAMTADRLAQIILNIDPDAQFGPNGAEFNLEEIPVLVVVAPRADRMRAMVSIASVEDVSREELARMMQANFDTALDARYAIAQGRIWSLYIHPLGALEREQFLSGLIQTVTLARTYGTLYSGGAQVFGGGDSNEIYEGLLEELLD